MNKILKLENCVSLILDYRGKTPKKMGSYWKESGIRVISANNVHNGKLTDEKSIRYVDKETYNKWMKEPIKRGDCFLVSEGATLGESMYWDSDEKIVLGQRLYAIRTNPYILDSKYLSMYLCSNICRNAINALSTGSTVFGISQKDLLKLDIVLPNIEIQKKIGNIKYYIDKKIENNNKINEELESMAKIIYDYWFLQFEFPNEEGKPYKSSGGKMVWNEELKREIPEGWRVNGIFDCMDIIYGIPLSTALFTENDGIPVIRIRDILANTVSARTTEKIDNKYLSKKKDLLIGMDGNFHMSFWSNDGDCINQRIVRIRENDNDKVSVLQIYFEIEPYIRAKEKNVSKSTVGHLSDKDLKQLRILVPSDKKIYVFFDKIVTQICNNKAENKELSSIREFILPLLMNGQIGFRELALAED